MNVKSMVVREMPFNVLVYGLSETGLVRQNNEDVWAELPDKRFYILADGMGGHVAGEIAARESVRVILNRIQEGLGSDPDIYEIEEASAILEDAIEQANNLVFRMGRADLELRGMGTTLCCLLFHQKGLVYANVGDSRIYRLRNKQLKQITKDHSLLRELMDLGELNETQAADFLFKNIVTKAVGTESSVEPSVYITELEDNDIYLMCSDGLSDLLSIQDIEEVLNETPLLKEAADFLIEKAMERGGHDNITVVIMKVQEAKENADTPG